MTDEELKIIKSKVEALPKGEISFKLMRDGSVKTLADGRQHRLDPRWDIYLKREDGKTIQLMHFHPESPNIHEKHTHFKEFGEFCAEARDVQLRLIQEIERLKNGI